MSNESSDKTPKRARPRPTSQTRRKKKVKPIDRWLTLGGVAMAILLFLFAKTSLIVVLCAVALFALLIHPVWNFWWIEKRRVRQFFFTGLLFIGCLLIGYKAWPTNEQEQPQIVQSQPSPPVSATPLSVLLTPSPSQQASPCANVYEPFRQACKRFKDRLGNPS